MIGIIEKNSLLDMFIFETNQMMEQMEQLILDSEAQGAFSQAAINEIFRIMHTVKGSAAMMMYQNISDAAHSMEDIFYYLREEKPSKVDFSALSDLLLDGLDFIKVEMEKINNKESSDGDSAGMIILHKEFLEGLKRNNSGHDRWKDPLQTNDRNINIKTYQSTAQGKYYKAVVYFQDGCGMENIRAFGIIHNLKNLAGEIHHLPEDVTGNNQSAELISMEGFIIYFRSELPFEKLKQFFQQTIFLKSLELTELDNPDEIRQFEKQDTYSTTDSPGTYSTVKDQKLTVKTAAGSEHEVSSLHQSFISVSVEKLDRLMDLVGEMVIAEAMVIHNPDLTGLELNNFQKSAHQLNKISNEIKDMVMSIRMVPLSVTFQKLHRIVRDMSRKLNKEVQLKILGEETEVDKNIIEHIADPLMHLVRNAVDHGIEEAKERELSGKPQLGTVTIEAKNAGSDVLIIIRDDGKGLDKEKILEKARKSNLISAEADRITDKEIYKLILQPGFSTNEQVTEYSGRGVGMDVVAKNIEAISGSLSIDSIPGAGTTVTIKIPLTLAIIEAMNLKVGNTYYSIPSIFIQEAFCLQEDHIIIDPKGYEMVMIRGQCYPVIRLHRLFHIPAKKAQLHQGIFIMIQQEGKKVCLFADELLGQQQIVMKSLPDYIKRFHKSDGISGCTLLGDGSISLILDAAGLANGINNYV